MTNKRIKLPKEGLIEPTDRPMGDDLIDADVEGHGFANPAPPAEFARRTPSQGGDFIPGDDDEDWKGLNDR